MYVYPPLQDVAVSSPTWDSSFFIWKKSCLLVQLHCIAFCLQLYSHVHVCCLQTTSTALYIHVSVHLSFWGIEARRPLTHQSRYSRSLMLSRAGSRMSGRASLCLLALSTYIYMYTCTCTCVINTSHMYMYIILSHWTTGPHTRGTVHHHTFGQCIALPLPLVVWAHTHHMQHGHHESAAAGTSLQGG